MRLLTVGSLPPEWGGPARGGVATFHAALLAGMSRRAEQTEIVGVVPPAPPERELPLPLPVFSRPANAGIAEFYESLLHRLDPDVVLMNHVAHTIGVTHARLGSPVPAVGVAHSWHNVTFGDPDEVGRQREITAEALAGLAALAVGSSHCLAQGRELGFQYPPIAEAVHYPLQPVYLERGIEVDAGDRTGVLFLGSLIPRKNPESLVEAATLLPGVEFTIAGEGELEASLHKLIARRELGGRVHVVGHLPVARHLLGVRDLLLRSRLMCLPSSSESFGLAFIEALACGTPVVGFGPTVREIREAMGVEIGEPLDDVSPSAIASAAERVLARRWDRAGLRRAALGAFGSGRAEGRYADLLSRVALDPVAGGG